MRRRGPRSKRAPGVRLRKRRPSILRPSIFRPSSLWYGWIGVLFAGAAACAIAHAPVVGFRREPLAALALVVIGAIAAFAPLPRPWAARARAGGIALLWATIAWCAVSQQAPLTEPASLAWSLGGLPVAIVAALWLWPLLPGAWQRRTLAAVGLPTVAGLGLVAWASPPRPLDFQPYLVAVDSHGTIYVTDAGAPVIRVFAPDGTLRGKLRPGLASQMPPPGPGFTPPGPYNDPDGLGVPHAAPGSGVVSGALRPTPFGTDDFWFCGMAVDAHNRLWVPDWMRGRMLRFAPDGRLDARWPLPAGYQPSLGCVAAAGGDVYLSAETGAVLRLNAAGRVLARWAVPEHLAGGISVSPDGTALYALATARVYRFDLRTGALTSWALPAPSGPLGNPYQAILALADGRVVITNLSARRVDIYRADGRPLGHWGGPGDWPGTFGQVGGLGRDKFGHIYVADVDHRVLQRFTSTGVPDALYRSPDDDEID